MLFVGTFLHPSGADPNDALAAFTEYADDQLWIASHLTQLLGVAMMVGALVHLSRILATGFASGWAWLGGAGAIASLASAAALQAVDGIALKIMVDAWAEAAEPDRTTLFYAAYGVRQIEVGLASIMSLLFGLTVGVYGVALIADRSFARWLGWLAIIGGIPTAVADVATVHDDLLTVGANEFRRLASDHIPITSRMTGCGRSPPVDCTDLS